MADRPHSDQTSLFPADPVSPRTASISQRLRPSKLKEARLALRLTQTDLAGQIGVTRQSISMYEQGQISPEPSVMERIAVELEQPLSYFADDAPPDFGVSSVKFFRKFGANTKRRNLASDVFGSWFARAAKYLDEFVNYPPLNIPVALSPINDNGRYTLDEIESAAAKCRESWGLGLGPISNMVALLENNGVAVCRYTIPEEMIEAFSFWNGDRALIFLASEKESASRARFDAAHELGHLILHRGIGPEELEDDKEQLKQVEREADLFASAFLLPKESFLAELFSIRLDAYLPLKRRWNVSVQAMITRTRDLGVIDDDQYTNLQKSISFRKWRRREPYDDLPLEEPQMLKQAAQLLLATGHKTVDEMAIALQFNRRVLEKLCNLPVNALDSTTSVTAFRPSLK